MEFLLINHPLDCPICDQAGECTAAGVQRRARPGAVRASSRHKVKKPKNVERRAAHPARRRAMQCICSRCVRFTREVVDDDVPRLRTDRGSHNVLTVHPGQGRWRTTTRSTPSTSARSARSPRTISASRCGSGSSRRPSSICTGCARGCNIMIGSTRRTRSTARPRARTTTSTRLGCATQGRLQFPSTSKSERRLTDADGERGPVAQAPGRGLAGGDPASAGRRAVEIQR